jgi:hypothetical protein
MPAALPNLLPGEPDRQLRGARLLFHLLLRGVGLGLALLLLGPLWPLYGLLRLGLERPPNVPHGPDMARCLRAILLEPLPGLGPLQRLSLLQAALLRLCVVPVEALAWWLDELLEGGELDAVELREPIFELSAARSGSTQLARYLEDDPSIASPTVAQTFLPYRWAWRLADWLLPPGPRRQRWAARMERWATASLPPEHHQRHEFDLFRTDTFEVLYMMTQLEAVWVCLGPRHFLELRDMARVHPSRRTFWEQDFLRFIDRLGRKTVLQGGLVDGRPRRLLVKGHFLMVARALEQRYPEARFLTVLRAPEQRLQSLINFLRCQPTDPACGPIPWPLLVEQVPEMEARYNLEELAFFTEEGPARRVVIPFRDYVADLEGTLSRVYLGCLDQAELPAHVPRSHAPRQRHSYMVDRSLEQLGLDSRSWLAGQADYLSWMAACSASQLQPRQAKAV